ncbi:MAG TPA: phosphoribosyltransferase family protein [Nitrososphaeraceae archaeon]|jgi:orotate phosphoribosyltransferase
MIDEKKLRLKQLIQERCIKVLDHDVALSSGETTNYYYDIKGLFDGEGLNLLGEIMLSEVSKFNPKSIGGLEVGAIPLISVIVAFDYYMKVNRTGLSGFYVRKSIKEHGLQKKIEGNLQNPVAIVEDVMTTGNSIKLAIDAVKEQGPSVVGVVCVIDREDARNVIKDHIRYIALFKHSEFEKFIEEQLSSRRK